MDLTMGVDEIAMTTDAPGEIIPPSQRVPPEIIVKIIHALLPTQSDDCSLMKKRLNVLLKATSICRYWRYVALGDATLWSVAPIDHRSLGELFLQRSRNVPLSITYEHYTRRCCPAHQAMVSLLPHMQRVKKVHVCASAPVLDHIISNLNVYTSGAQLEEIRITVIGTLNDRKCSVALDLLLKNASTLKVLQLNTLKCRLTLQKLQQFPCLTHLELLVPHGFYEVSPLLTSLPTLSFIKVCVKGPKEQEDLRIVPQANLRHIHLQIHDLEPNSVLDALEIPTGVHLECEMLFFVDATIMNRFLPLPPESFQNTSRIEELRIFSPSRYPISIASYSGSGPTGSFCIRGMIPGGYRPPIRDFSHLQKLFVEGPIDLLSLENIVTSAPRLASVSLVDCVVIKSHVANDVFEAQSSPVDVDSFVMTVSEERRMGVGGTGCVRVNGTLEGEFLERFKSRQEDRDRVAH